MINFGVVLIYQNLFLIDVLFSFRREYLRKMMMKCSGGSTANPLITDTSLKQTPRVGPKRSAVTVLDSQ